MDLERIKENRRSSGYMGYEKILVAEVKRLQQLNRDIVERYSEAAEKAEAEREKLLKHIKDSEDIYKQVSGAKALMALNKLVRGQGELEEALRECCRMFEWCDTRYGQLLKEKE